MRPLIALPIAIDVGTLSYGLRLNESAVDCPIKQHAPIFYTPIHAARCFPTISASALPRV